MTLTHMRAGNDAAATGVSTVDKDQSKTAKHKTLRPPYELTAFAPKI